MATYLTTGIILSRRPYGENDRLFTVYTADRGKITAVARGARKIESKLASHLEPVCVAELMLARTRGAHERVAGASVMRTFPGIRGDVLATGFAQYYVEALDGLVGHGLGDVDIFDLTHSFLDSLERSASEAPKHMGVVSLAYALRLLDALGMRPELGACVSCGKNVRAWRQKMDLARGGLVCSRCGRSGQALVAVSSDAVRAMNVMLDGRARGSDGGSLSVKALREACAVIGKYLVYKLERPLASEAFLKSLGTGS